MARVDFGGVVRETCLAYVPEAKAGDYCIIHVGLALNLISEEEAQETLDLLRQVTDLASPDMMMQVAGPGCMNCRTTEQRVINACTELDLAADISHVTGYDEMLKLGVLRTPAVVIDGEIAIAGRVPSVAELKTLLAKKRG